MPHNMRKAIGFVIVLWALSRFFDSFTSFDDAASATFNTVEAAANHATAQIEQMPFTIE